MTWIQILIPVLFVLGPVLGQIIKKLKEQAELRQIEIERQRLRDEMLRTGRAPAEAQASTRDSARSTPRPTPQGGAAARTNLEEIARRRQAQLEELRRRQQAARAQATARQAPARPAPPTAPGRPIPQARPTQQPLPAPQPRPAPQARPQPVGRHTAPAQRRTAPARPAPTPRRPSRSRAPEVAPPPTARKRRRRLGEFDGLGSIEVVAPPKAASPAPVRMPRTPEDWRRAIVLSELLAPPVSLRDEHA